MFADADVEIFEPIQPDITSVLSTVPSLQVAATIEKVFYLILLVHSVVNNPTLLIKISSHMQAPNFLALSYSFDLGEYIDEDEVSSSATSSKEALLEGTKNQLRDILPMFEKNIADLVQDTDLTQRVFLDIKGNPSPVLQSLVIFVYFQRSGFEGEKDLEKFFQS